MSQFVLTLMSIFGGDLVIYVLTLQVLFRGRPRGRRVAGRRVARARTAEENLQDRHTPFIILVKLHFSSSKGNICPLTNLCPLGNNEMIENKNWTRLV